jgi:hypothetical protein
MTPLEELTEKARIELKEKMRYAHDHNIPLHNKRCGNCALKGTFHEAEFIGLRDEDGQRLLNIVDEDPIIAMLWVNFNGCLTFKKKGTTENVCSISDIQKRGFR